ncbi:MAG: hypothetical protein JNL67_07675 [Planctomycetaceae bacterium]|nr:hypothetical protein [Planctomycetaceae bacterium]
MNQRHLFSLLLLSLTFVSQVRADFTPIAGWDKQLFPSFVIGTAALKTEETQANEFVLGDSNGLLGVEIVAPEDNTNVEVTIECSEYAAPSQFVGRLPQAGQKYSVFPKMKYRYDAMSQCYQATPANVTYRVRINGGEVIEKTVTITVRPINDCPIKIQIGDEIVDASFTFATYVNEQHPYTDKLLREALDIGIVDAFTGYQSNSDEEVLRQVYAIWDLLVSRDVRYSNITTTSSDSSQILSQNVRLLESTINNLQANCVDGSVLMVSMLRKIDIESFLILVPGHCYIGFYLDAEKTKILAIETTLVGSELEEPEQISEVLLNAVDESLRGEYSWPSFVQALELGTGKWLESKDKFSDPAEPDYRIIDIAAARQLGVLPIPFRGNEEFLAFDHSLEEEYWEESEDGETEDAEYEEYEESDEDSGYDSEAPQYDE